MTDRRLRAVVIGASAGAVEALSVILSALPAGFRPPVLIVVHLPADRTSIMAELFQNRCRIPVREADDKEPIDGGGIFFAPPDYHLLVESPERLSLSADEAVNYSRPSIDVLFESAAEVFSRDLVGIILTGANRDGAAGFKAIADQGGTLLVQSPETALSPEMPLAALEECPQARVLGLEEIASWLVERDRTV